MTGGVHLSAGCEERAKATRLEASSCGGGGNSAGRHRRAGRLGRPRGRGPVERGGAAGWKEKKRMGCGWAERLDRPEVTQKILFQIKFDFLIYQGFGNLHKEI
jgi:hypothetical protein